MNRDLHPDLGPRARVASLEVALQRVREVYPAAHMEGSTGAERSFWQEGRLVAHAWPITPRSDALWLRVAPAPEATMPAKLP